MEGYSDSFQVVIFQLGQEYYGIPILGVQEIILTQLPTKIPNAPEFFKGIINLRGNVIPVIDLGQRFKIATEAGQEQRYVVLEVKGNILSIIVDSVSEVLAISESNVKSPGEGFKAFDNRFIKGILPLDQRLIILLDIDKLFSEDELLALAKTMEEH
jgi:purine-binding chemotaxis protein CheW